MATSGVFLCPLPFTIRAPATPATLLMPKHMLRPPGQYPRANLARRLAACFYDFLLSVALMMVITLVYQQAVLRLVYGSEQLLAMSQAGALDRDPLLASLVLLGLFAFYAKFWTHNGQTLGMQA